MKINRCDLHIYDIHVQVYRKFQTQMIIYLTVEAGNVCPIPPLHHRRDMVCFEWWQ